MWAWTLAAIALTVVLLLSVPLEIAFRVHRGEAARVMLVWLFGLVRIPLTPDKGRPERAKKPKRARASSRRRIVRLAGDPRFLRRLAWLARKTIGAVRLRGLRLRLRIGLEDPCETGWLWALFGPFGLLLDALPGARVDVAPDFSAERLELDAEGNVRVIPAQIAGMAVAFALSPATLRAVRMELKG